MTDAPDLYIKRYEPTDARLGRHVVHDPRSRSFVHPAPVDTSTWTTTTITIKDPVPNPNQIIGNCTGVAKCVMFNAKGNRRRGVRLDMEDATHLYEIETAIDAFPGQYPPDDTGSNGLAACKAAQQLGWGAGYDWIFTYADGIVQAVVQGDVVNVGTRWDQNMFTQDSDGRIHPGGGVAGGHEWSVIGYDVDRDWVKGRCWWGSFQDFWISRTDLEILMHDDGDAHVQKRVFRGGAKP